MESLCDNLVAHCRHHMVGISVFLIFDDVGFNLVGGMGSEEDLFVGFLDGHAGHDPLLPDKFCRGNGDT